MAKNIQSLQLLRNGNAYASKTAAYEALENTTGLQNVAKKDGVAVLARYIYTEGEGESQVKQIRTLVGYYAEASAMTSTDDAVSHMTIIDVEGTAADVEQLKARLGDGVTTENTATMQFAVLSGTSSDTSAATSIVGAKKYADEKVNAALDALDATTVADVNKIVSDVTQADGKISATAKNLTAVRLGGYTGGTDADIVETDTLGEALGKLQAQINAMDLTAVTAEGSVITSVSEEDGKVSATATPVKDIRLNGYSKTSATGAVAPTDDVEDALSKLENNIAAAKSATTLSAADKSVIVTTADTGTTVNVNINSNEKVIKLGDNGIYTDIKISGVTNSEANVKEAWGLFTGTEQLGDTIKIYKDSSLVRFYIGHTDDKLTDEDAKTHESPTSGVTNGSGNAALVYIMQLANSNYQLTAIDVESFLDEAEFKDGLQVNNHEVSVKVDASSEKVTTGENTTVDVLTVSDGGVKVNNIQNAIDYKISTLDATKGTTTVDTGKHVAVQVVEENGLISSVTVTEEKIADADDLSNLSGETVTEVASSNASITAALSAATNGTKHLDIITDASKIKMSGFTPVDSASSLSNIAVSSSVTEAFEEADRVITSNEQVVSAALNDLETTKVDVITVNGKQSKAPASGDVVASVTIDGADIKLDGYESGSSSAAVVSSDTVNQAIGKLENQVNAAVAGGLQAVESGNGISVSAVENNRQTISVNLKANVTATGSEWENPLKFDETSKGLYFDSLDCGTY